MGSDRHRVKSVVDQTFRDIERMNSLSCLPPDSKRNLVHWRYQRFVVV